MMSRLVELQSRMQAAILIADGSARNALLADLKPAAHTSRDVMVGIYCSAYRARLAEILESDLECVARYLGNELFAHFANGYIDAHPSDVRNARYFSRHAVSFLTATEPFARWPQVAELAAIELALADAFDAAEATSFTLEQLMQIAPADWASLDFAAHPAVRRLDSATNAYAIWQAVRDKAEPPQARIHTSPEPIVVWRDGAQSRLRALSIGEATALDVMLCGKTFDAACTALAKAADVDEDTAQQAVGYLAGWIANGLLLAPRK